MPLRVRTQIEPFTESSKLQVPILATSREFSRLYRDLKRYTIGQISGRSYLIAGHRGSGKTMLVYNAIERLQRECARKTVRPIFVRLHGPDLLPELTSSTSEGEDGNNKQAKGTAASNQIAIAFSGDSPASVTTATQPSAATKTDLEMTNILTEMMKCLFREVSEEFRVRFRVAALDSWPKLRQEELLEVAAQLDLEMAESPSASRLRNFWSRIGALQNGVLFPLSFEQSDDWMETEPAQWPQPAMNRSPQPDAGLKEILVLSFLGQAYQVISGKIEEKQKQSEAAKNERSSAISTAYDLKNLLAPLAGLVSGGAVGVGIGGSVRGVLLGLLTGAVVSLGFRFSNSRAQSKEITLESVFIKDRSIASLSGVLPVLIQRIRDIGLAPIFVVDELDKVEGIEDRMQKLVKYLKFLVTEKSFTCFLTDRRYLTHLNRQASETAYAREYTYFSDNLLVLYRPVELRDFVKNVIEIVTPPQTSPNVVPTQGSTQMEKDQQEVEKISYVLLFRARMHPIDLRRQLDSLTGSESFSMADSFSSPRSRFEILMQVAIEWLLDGEDVQARISGNPFYRQVVYDALYYVSRLWEDAGADEPRVPGFKEFGTPEEKKPGLELDKKKFSKYIESRSALEDKVQPPKEAATVEIPKTHHPDPPTEAAPDAKAGEPRISGKDSEFLFRKVEELLNFLCNPKALISEINYSRRHAKPLDFILNEIPKDPSMRLLIKKEDYLKTKADKRRKNQEQLNYRWLYDISGRYLQDREASAIIDEVEEAITYIREVMASLNELGVAGDLQALADAKVIPRPSEWREVVQPALERLDRLSAERNAYGNMSADRDAVLEFANTLEEFEPNLKAALLSTALFAPEIRTSLTGWSPRLSASLNQISLLLQLSANPEEDLHRLSVLLSSVPTSLEASHQDELNTVVEVATDLRQQRPAAPEQADAVVKAAWDIAKTRFGKLFRDGTVRFDPLFEDVFTSLRKVGPGHELRLDFSTHTARDWTSLLLRSLSEDQVPAWLRVAASLELGLLELADKLVPTLADDAATLSQWVDDAKRNVAAQTTRRSILVFAAEQKSLTESWKPSTRHAALVATASDFGRLAEELKKYGIGQPVDYPIELVAIELTGDGKLLGRLATMTPKSAISEISPKAGSTSKALVPFLELRDFGYIAGEAPLPQTSSPIERIVVAPKGLDDLIDHFPGLDSSIVP